MIRIAVMCILLYSLWMCAHWRRVVHALQSIWMTVQFHNQIWRILSNV